MIPTIYSVLERIERGDNLIDLIDRSPHPLDVNLPSPFRYLSRPYRRKAISISIKR